MSSEIEGLIEEVLPSEDETEDLVVESDDRPVASQTADWTISALRDKFERGQIDVQPEYQREYVWALKPELPSRLIESLLLNIPIPPIYFGKMPNKHFEVIDGQQRLTTLIRFVRNEFPLQKLQRLASLNGKRFHNLSEEYQSTVLDATIRTIVIDAGQNHNLRYEVFERLNRGSIALNEQELRNCIYRGPFCDLLTKLEREPFWRKVKGSEKPEPRFLEREMILRFFAFANRIDSYAGNLKRFLNDYMAIYAHKDQIQINALEDLFRQTMQNVSLVFGSNAGHLYSTGTEDHPTVEGSWDTRFSIAALDIQASALIGYAPAKVQVVAEQIREAYIFYLLTNPQVRLAISRQPAGKNATKLRWFGFKAEVQRIFTNDSVEPRFFNYNVRLNLYNNNRVCAICKNEIHSIDDGTVDHIIPHSKGGKTVIDNAQLVHRSCAARRYTRLIEGTIGDNGLPEAQILLNVGHIAAAGATAGLVLERHLKLLCNQQQPPLAFGQSDGISRVNDILKKANMYDTAQWRQIQLMADVRNNCDHPGTNPPTRENVDDLIKMVKSLLTTFPLASNA
jgi:hypothetical protein